MINKNEIYIGENLTIMSSGVLDKYINKVKMIYIDPPYNTGGKFSYKDKQESYSWEYFMKERLLCAIKYLMPEGVIFISIDDNEYAILKIICDSVFDKKNFVGTFITHQSQRSNAKHINIVHEYILAYAKDKSKLDKFQIKRIDEKTCK